METNESITISQFKATCLAVLEHVKRTGRPILVTRRGKPIATISPPPPPEKNKSWLGSYREEGVILGDVVSPDSDADDWEALFEK